MSRIPGAAAWGRGGFAVFGDELDAVFADGPAHAEVLGVDGVGFLEEALLELADADGTFGDARAEHLIDGPFEVNGGGAGGFQIGAAFLDYLDGVAAWDVAGTVRAASTMPEAAATPIAGAPRTASVLMACQVSSMVSRRRLTVRGEGALVEDFEVAFDAADPAESGGAVG